MVSPVDLPTSNSSRENNVKRAAVLQLLAERGWISLNQLSQLLGIAYPTALRMKRAGHIKVIPVGGIHRIYLEEYNRLQKEGNKQ